ncbi:family 1 encapsulin nanocompartment shell protein [Georgenia ruanii]|uniref:Type 1 encapsulin shell protein n=1 Tax=Georgenia ruanii TaxID=348442 RepID=A0A7J9UWB2_9MICO|nr:family 1 encapsulin nanocompartment shell protein [Georgenia ruanii]MPV88906.1 bacteriocin [Georgenia ruanii]
MDHLLRGLAPVSDAAWTLLDAEARSRLVVALGARKLVDFAGPHGWQHSATNLGRTEPVADTPTEQVRARRRRVLPLVEVRADFDVLREELVDVDRGAADVDLTSLDAAAMRMAQAENTTVFHGWTAAGITGIGQASPHPEIPAGADVDAFPSTVAKAVETLLKSGVSGPYGLAVGPARYTAIVETAEHGGYPLWDHVRQILGGPIVWAPGVRGGVVLSMRGGDFLFESGEDLAVGYDHHDERSVHLYLEQTFSFRVATAEAAVALTAQ